MAKSWSASRRSADPQGEGALDPLDSWVVAMRAAKSTATQVTEDLHQYWLPQCEQSAKFFSNRSDPMRWR
jgi:hypothetical protein